MWVGHRPHCVHFKCSFLINHAYPRLYCPPLSSLETLGHLKIVCLKCSDPLPHFVMIIYSAMKDHRGLQVLFDHHRHRDLHVLCGLQKQCDLQVCLLHLKQRGQPVHFVRHRNLSYLCSSVSHMYLSHHFSRQHPLDHHLHYAALHQTGNFQSYLSTRNNHTLSTET